VVSDDDYLYFVDRALDGMAAILAGLGDDRANRRRHLAQDHQGHPGGRQTRRSLNLPLTAGRL
jgi:hypothetical protein